MGACARAADVATARDQSVSQLRRSHLKPPADRTPRLGQAAAVAMAVGMVLGAGVFRSPTDVAANVPDLGWLAAIWLLGGLISLAGGLCYAELASAFPHAGGDYHFLRLAYGRTMAFLFAWSRFLVVNTGSLALLGFVLGDYLQAVAPLGSSGPAIYAALAVMGVTLLNLGRLRTGLGAQEWLTGALIAGLGLVIIAALMSQGLRTEAASPQDATPLRLGQALIFVLFAYGGWNEVSTLSADLKGGPRAIVWTLLISLGLITVLYLGVNLALADALGLRGLAQAVAPADPVVEAAFGPVGRGITFAIVAAAVLTSLNATVIAGSRTTFAAAADWPQLAWLAKFDASAGVARAAVAAQGAIALLLVFMGSLTRSGFEALVYYTTPVFWLFLGLNGLAVVVLRVRSAGAARPFRTPLYPALPIAFAAASAYMVYAGVAYVKTGALAGLGVLALGVLAAALLGRAARPAQNNPIPPTGE